METVDVAFAILGLGALLAGVLPRVVERRPLSMPIAFLGLGMMVFLLPTGLPVLDPLAHRDVATHLTEIGLIVALTCTATGGLWAIQAANSPEGTLDGSPPQAFYVFIIIGTLAGIGARGGHPRRSWLTGG